MNKAIPTLLTFILFFLHPSSAIAEHETRITLSQEGVVTKKADQLTLQVGAVTISSKPDQAILENGQKMAALVAELKKLSLDENEIATSFFELTPLFSDPKKGEQEPKIVSYRVSNTVEITTTKLELAPKIIDLAASKGNTINNLHFSLRDQDKYRTEAINLASKRLLRDAATLAESLGLKVKRIEKLQLDDASFEGPSPKSSFLLARSHTPVEPSMIDVAVRITASIFAE